MNHQIKTEFERPLDPRSGECVVGNRKNFSFACNLRDPFQIYNCEQRIARRLDPNHPRILFNCRFKATCFGKIDISEIEIRGTTPDFFEKSESAAIKVVADDEMV